MTFPSISKFLFGPLVQVIRIDGIVTPNTTNAIGNYLKKIRPSRTQGIAIVFNSRGGSSAQCHSIRNQLVQFSNDNSIPLYCFAESYATHGAYHIFSCGNEIYANPASIIGNAQEPQADVDCSKFFEKQKIELRLLASNPMVNDYRFNWATQDHQDAKLTIQELTQKMSKRILGDILTSRGQKLKIGEELLVQEFTGLDAVKNGLADQQGTYEVVMAEKFPAAKIHHVSMRQWSFLSSYQWEHKYGKAIPLSLLVMLFSFKVMLKYFLIIKSYLLMKSQEESNEEESATDKASSDH